MNIDQQLLEKYFKGACTDEEAEKVAAYLQQAYTPEADTFFLAAAGMLTNEKDTPVSVPSTGKNMVRRLLKWQYAAAAALVSLCVMGWLWQQEQRPALQAFIVYDTIYNNSSSIRIIHMSDSSRIWLNTRSSIVYTHDYNVHDRELWLNGEAYFEVGQKAASPFRVHTGELVTTALGTSFNIATSNKADGTIEVSLLEGKVAVSDTLRGGSFRYILQPGQQFAYTAGMPVVAAPQPFNAAITLGWRKSRIVFDNTALVDAFAHLQSRYGYKINIEDKQLAGKKISGIFRASQSLDSILYSLSYVHRFNCVRIADSTYSIKSK